MRLRIRHQTSYDYGQPVRAAIQMLRMTPRSSEGLFVRRWRVEVDADARLHKGEDAFGNITHTLFIDGPVESVRVSIDGEVETTDTNGLVRGAVERMPVRLYLRETRLTEPSQAMKSCARHLVASEGGNKLAALHALMTRLHASMRFSPGMTTSATPAAAAFEAGDGVCQDFAHIFVACARSIGVPARYVGGYFLRTDSVEQDAGHAWAEAYLDDIGWIGFDPANGMCVTERYCRVAVGLDYLDAAPVRGSRTGGGSEKLQVQVQVQQVQKQTQQGQVQVQQVRLAVDK